MTSPESSGFSAERPAEATETAGPADGTAASRLVPPVFSAPPVPTRGSVARLRATGVLSAAAWREAMDFCGFIPDGEEWRAYLRQILLLGGALFLAAGVIFFIAWNWADMHRFARLALVGVVVAATGAASVWRGPDTPLGRILLLCCGISIGPMLAVFGQTYQTGAELWELFRVWTVVLLALALAGKQAALWFVTWLAANVFVMLWLGRSMDEPLEAIGIFSLLPECVLALAVAVAAWELAAVRARAGERADEGPGTGSGRRRAWLQSRWLPRLLFFDLTARLTVYVCLFILDSREIRHLAVFLLPHAVLPLLAAAVAGGSWYWHRKRVPDLFMPACLVAGGCAIIVSILIEAEFLFDAGVGAVFAWGLLIVGLTAGAGKILLTLQQRMEQDDGRREGGIAFGNAVTAFFAPARPVPSWETLWARLKGAALLAADVPLPQQGPQSVPQSGSPWYVRVMLALGGWVAALLFVLFLAMFLFMSMGVRGNEGITLFLASWVPLGVGYACLKSRGDLIRHFGFSLALAGSIAACIGLAWGLGSWRIAPFLCAVLLVPLCFVMNSTAYRLLAALAVVQLVATGILALLFLGWSPGGWGASYWIATGATAVWWAGVSIGLAALRVHESDWLARPAWNLLEPVFAGAYGGMMLYLITALSARLGVRGWGMGSGFFPTGSFAVGLGAAAGLLFLVRHLMRGRGEAAERAGVTACAALALPLGWFLPGAALAAYGLALSRYSGNAVMQGVTASFLFAYMVYYYYFLGTTLLYKSLLMLGAGAVLLCLAFALERVYGKGKGGRFNA